MDWRISSLWSRFFLRNPSITNKTHIPLLKNNNKILFYIKKINKKIKGWGGFGHPRPAGLGWLGWPKPPRGLWGWPGHPQGQTNFLFFLDLAIGGGRTTPKGHGVASATPNRRSGVAEATPPPNWGGLG
jgi:hypothetical protein